MRQETIVKTYVTFDELNPKQQQKALDAYRDINVDHDWWEHVLADRSSILVYLGFNNINFQWSGFGSQGDGCSFTGSFVVPKTVQELKERIKLVEEHMPGFDLHGFKDITLAGDDDLELEVYNHNGNRYYNSASVVTDDETVTEFVRDFCDSMYLDLEKEYYWLCSDEQVAESLRANEVEFDLDQYPA